METPNPCNWSNIHLDILISLFERLSFMDFQCAKLVCTSWYSGSKLTVPRESGFPWLMLFPEESGCVMYNPKEDKVYKSLRDFSGTRFLANSGKWFMVIDSRSNLCIIDMLSENRIQLPPLESLLSNYFTIIRVRDREFERVSRGDLQHVPLNLDELRGLLWVDESTEEYVAVWFFGSVTYYIPYWKSGNYCKSGQSYYTEIPLYRGVPKLLQGLRDMTLKGYRLYILSLRSFVRVIDLSGEIGFFEDVTGSNLVRMLSTSRSKAKYNIAVTTSGEVLLVGSKTTAEGTRSFFIEKKDPIRDPSIGGGLLELDSLGDEALLVDLGITVPANPSIGIKPNSVYFTYHDRADRRPPFEIDICEYSLETKTVKRYTNPTNRRLKDARWWFFSMT